MKSYLAALIGIIVFQPSLAQEVPYRDESTYKLELKMEFKVPDPEPNNVIDPVKNRIIPTDPELYVNLNLKLLKLLPEDTKLKVMDNKGITKLTKKLKDPDEYLIKIGRAMYVKEKKIGNIITVMFFNGKKENTSRITIEFKENGDFIVNDQLFGKI